MLWKFLGKSDFFCSSYDRPVSQCVTVSVCVQCKYITFCVNACCGVAKNMKNVNKIKHLQLNGTSWVFLLLDLDLIFQSFTFDISFDCEYLVNETDIENSNIAIKKAFIYSLLTDIYLPCPIPKVKVKVRVKEGQICFQNIGLIILTQKIIIILSIGNWLAPCVCVRVRARGHVRICVCVHVCICMYVCICVHVYVYVYAYVYVYVYVYVSGYQQFWKNTNYRFKNLPSISGSPVFSPFFLLTFIFKVKCFRYFIWFTDIS